MYELVENKAGKTITHCFTHEQDYKNYKDYLKNGLKMTEKRSDIDYRFNDGSRLFLIKMLDGSGIKAILEKNNRTIEDKRQTKKYLSCIGL